MTTLPHTSSRAAPTDPPPAEPPGYPRLPEQGLGIDEAEAQARFDRLQRRLVPLWRSIERMTADEQTIVVVPSISLDLTLTAAEMQAYEERFLFLLLLLRQPSARMVYLTSRPIRDSVVEYVLDLLPGVVPSHARRRLALLSPEDGSVRPLTAKILERPTLVERIRSFIADPHRAHLVPFITTRLERDLALRLDIPVYGADPQFLPFGSKSGGRRLFREEEIPHPAGREGVSSVSDVVDALAELRASRPDVEHVVVKLDEGASGEGNARIDLSGADGGAGALEERVRAMRFEHGHVRLDDYLDKLARGGGVVEEYVRGAEVRSPSVQLRVTPLGEVQLLSTHDQLLGGSGGQSYLGCRFPADSAYAGEITRLGARVGERLAREGVLGRFALDFVVVRDTDGTWQPYAIELNLRKGGTTHPFLTLQFLTDGTYDPDAGVFRTPLGSSKSFVASDHVKSPLYRALTSEDVLDLLAREGLHFDGSRQSGVVFHMLSALGECGRLGLTAVGDSPEEAQSYYDRAVQALDAAASRAVAWRPLDAERAAAV